MVIAEAWNPAHNRFLDSMSNKALVPGLGEITATLEQRAKLGECFRNFGLGKMFNM